MARLTTLRIGKESHKFSAAHFTVFSASERERLHGHNYGVSIRLVAPMGPEGFSADYNVYKQLLQALCDEHDEYMLLARDCRHQTIRYEGEQIVVEFAGKESFFRADEALVRPVVNITVEELSHYLLELLVRRFQDESVIEVELSVSSGSGQEASSVWRRT